VSEARIKAIFLSGGAVLTLLFALSPFMYMVLTGMSRHPDFLRPEQPLELTADHYLTVLTTGSLHFMDYLRNSLAVSAVSAVCSVFAASLAAYALTRLTLPGKTLFMLFTLSVSLFPPVSLVSYLFKFMAEAGWINTHQALILPYVAWTLPLSLWIMVSYFSQVPQDLDRAALVDGCTRFQVLIRVILPVAVPGVVSTALLAFIFAFNEFLFALLLTTDYRARTIPVGIALFEGLHGQLPWGEIMAAAALTTIPVVILALIFQRRIVQGLTRGAVKA
jgi:multiple sugar transport system permease protein